MFSLKKMFAFAIIAILSIGVLMVGVAGASEPTPVPWPIVTSVVTPNSETATELQNLVKRYYDITGQAARIFDVTQFASVFVDAPNVSLDTWQVEAMAQLKAQGSGMLSYELAFFGNWKQGAEKFEQLQATAKAQGRTISSAEMQAISSADGIPPAPRRTDPMHKQKVTFLSFSRDGANAIVEFDDGAQNIKFFCINTKDGWKVAGMRVLSTHV